MKYKKYMRLDTETIFWVRTNDDGSQFLCSNSLRVLKHLGSVRDFEKRFIALT